MDGKSLPKDMIGQQFGSLLVTHRGGTASNGQAMWSVICEKCGSRKEVTGSNLRRGLTRGCGCDKHQKIANTLRRHGMAGTRTHRIWCGMRQRCNNPASPSYRFYGANGIRVCDRWLQFDNFLQDMGVAPEGCTLDRINSAGNYEPSNCRWATHREQANNTKRNVRLETPWGEMTIAQLSRRINVSPTAIRNRILAGDAGDDLVRPRCARKSTTLPTAVPTNASPS